MGHYMHIRYDSPINRASDYMVGINGIGNEGWGKEGLKKRVGEG